MKPIFVKTHANISQYGYLWGIGLAIISLILSLFNMEQWYITALGNFGIYMSCMSLLWYAVHFFMNLKQFLGYKWLFIGNMLFICFFCSSLILFYILKYRSIRELIIVVVTTLLFLLISKPTCQILIKRYNPEPIK